MSHLVCQDAECPIVDSFVVAHTQEGLRSYVLGRPTQCISQLMQDTTIATALVVVRNFLGEAHVNQREVPIRAHHDVLRLEITVHEAPVVDKLECEEHVGDVKAGNLRLELSIAFVRVEKREELASLVEVGQQIDGIVVLVPTQPRD